MIIPKAIFLHQAYIRAGTSVQHQTAREQKLFYGRIVRALRAPCNHSLGKVTLALSRKDYPVLTGEGDSLNRIQDEIISSGYIVSISRQNNGDVQFCIDWTTVNCCCDVRVLLRPVRE